MFKNIEAVIMDLDGTLVDSGYVWSKVDRDFFSKRGMEIPAGYTAKINSLSFREVAEFTKREYGISESIEEIMAEWNNMAAREYAVGVRLKDGAAELLKKLKGENIKIGLATANTDELFMPCLKNNNVDIYFDTYAHGGEVKNSKEFPDIYLLCAERLETRPERCLVFEDITRGIRGAKKAGMKTCGVYDGYTAYEWPEVKKMADYSIKSFRELL
ncbi:MAG: HAD family phosphatase [Clostridiales bacterium]|nr:HAD family phosphatase [Clostridiales bacterium]